MSIQGNPLGLKQVEARLFNIYDIDAHKYLDIQDVIEWSKVTSVPLVEPVATAPVFLMDVDMLRALAEKQVYQNGKPAEGIVVRPTKEETIVIGNEERRVSFKVVNPLYKD